MSTPRPLRVASGGALSVLAAAMFAFAGTAAASAARLPTLVVSRHLGATVRLGAPLAATGTIRSTTRSTVALQLDTNVTNATAAATWHTVTEQRFRSGRHRFSLRSTAPTTPQWFRSRVVTIVGSKVVRAGEDYTTLDEGPVNCTPESTPIVPAGDGWISGGFYDGTDPDNPYPVCSSATITASDASTGQAVESGTTSPPSGFLFVLPAGTYVMSFANPSLCRDVPIPYPTVNVTVTAGQGTSEDINC